jgi:hypothetical protein
LWGRPERSADLLDGVTYVEVVRRPRWYEDAERDEPRAPEPRDIAAAEPDGTSAAASDAPASREEQAPAAHGEPEPALREEPASWDAVQARVAHASAPSDAVPEPAA